MKEVFLRAAVAMLAVILVASFSLPASSKESIPFETVHSGLIQLEVSLNGGPLVPVLLDLGAGITTLSGPQARLLHFSGTDVFTGFRMGGQRIDAPIGGPMRIGIGSHIIEVGSATVWDGLDKEGTNAIISAGAFRNAPFTIDFARKQFVLEDASTLRAREHSGERAALLTSDDRGISLDLFARFDFGNGQSGLCILDTGSQGVFLNKRYAPLLGIDLSDTSLRHIHTDQSDAVVAALPSLALHGAPSTARAGTHAIFSDMIYDCNVGTLFWAEKSLTIDIPNKRIFIGPHA